MGDKSNIEWTDATWNPIVGCSIVSPGCTNCYAMKMAARITAADLAQRDPFVDDKRTHYAGTTQPSKVGAVWTGHVALAPDHLLTAPLRWKRPRMIFTNSMGDLFHESVPDEWIDKVFAVMALTPQHTFQVLTKRAERMLAYLSCPDVARRIVDATDDEVIHYEACEAQPWGRSRLALGLADVFAEQVLWESPESLEIVGINKWPLPNVWLGVSTERQQEADVRIPLLLRTPAAVRFISAEPLLGPIDLMLLGKGGPKVTDALQGCVGTAIGDGEYEGAQPCAKLDWVIVGGESGPGARPMSIQWARELRDQCASGDVSFFFKQWGEWAPSRVYPSETKGRFAFGDYEHDRSAMVQVDHYPRQFTKFGARSTFEWVGKTKAGRLLDGKEHNGFPQAKAALFS